MNDLVIPAPERGRDHQIWMRVVEAARAFDTFAGPELEALSTKDSRFATKVYLPSFTLVSISALP